MHLLRHALILFRRQPAYAATSAVSIAVGMSLALAVFAVVNAVLFRPLPFLDADRLVMMYVPAGGGTSGRFSVLDAIQRQAPSIDRSAAYTYTPTIIGRSGEARTLVAARVSPGFFGIVGLRPIVGMDLDAGGDGHGDRSALISHFLWSTQFGSDSAVIGGTIVVGGESRTILGVMPKGFAFPNRASVWLPMATTGQSAQSQAPYFILGRLADHASVATAESQVAVINRRVMPGVTQSISAKPRVLSLRLHLMAGLATQLQLWLTMAILVLILCAVNFATMSFARGTARRHELAVRRALGGSGRRVTTALVGESAMVALAGGLLTVPLAWWLVRFADVVLTDGDVAIHSSISWQTACFGIIATAIVGVAFAALPAIEAARVDIRSVMQSGASGTTPRQRELGSRKALVGFQVTLALTATALVTALVDADRRYQHKELGVDPSRLLIAYVHSVDTSLGLIALGSLTEHVSGTAGIDAAAVYNACDEAVAVPYSESLPGLSGVACSASRDFFATVGVKTLAGRLPRPDELSSSADVVVLTRSHAVKLFGSSSMAVGRRIEVHRRGWDRRPQVVVGVVEDIGDAMFGFSPSIVRVRDIRMHQSAVLVVRTKGEPRTVVRSFASVVRAADARLVVSDVATAADVVSRGRLKAQGRRYFLLGVAALAVTLAIIGVFSLTAYSTVLREREFGIRLALGAAPRRLAWLVVRELRWSAAIGVATGVLASVLMTAYIDSIIRPGHMTSPLVTLPIAALVASSGALMLIMALGAGVPLRRLLRLDVARSLSAS